MIQVINGLINQYKLPKVGTLKDGRTVSGYNQLMLENPELAKSEGWLPLEDLIPEYNPETQYLVNDGYEILEDKIVKKYRIENIPEQPEPEPSEIDLLKNEIEELKQTIDVMLGGEIIE